MGGRAYTAYNIVLIAIRPNGLDAEITGLTHELAHLLIEEVTFNCLGELPSWLHEGLATYAEGALPSYQQELLNGAIRDGELRSVRSLSSSFPAGDREANLAYSQSYSLVDFLIEAYGWDKVNRLLATFREGSTPDN